MKPKVKLLSIWLGQKPYWYGKFVSQMSRIRTVDWECLPHPDVPTALHLDWFNLKATRRLGTLVSKGTAFATCDVRPAYGKLFEEYYRGYEWWGWCDLDMVLSPRFDEIISNLANPSYDVVTFKNRYFSGCLTLLRNTPAICSIFRSGPYREIFADPRPFAWDEESGLYAPGEGFHKWARMAGVRVNAREDLNGYDTNEEPNIIEVVDGRMMMDGKEVLFNHFMSKIWPVDDEGQSLWRFPTLRQREIARARAASEMPKTETAGRMSARVDRKLWMTKVAHD